MEIHNFNRRHAQHSRRTQKDRDQPVISASQRGIEGYSVSLEFATLQRQRRCCTGSIYLCMPTRKVSIRGERFVRLTANQAFGFESTCRGHNRGLETKHEKKKIYVGEERKAVICSEKLKKLSSGTLQKCMVVAQRHDHNDEGSKAIKLLFFFLSHAQRSGVALPPQPCKLRSAKPHAQMVFCVGDNFSAEAQAHC